MAFNLMLAKDVNRNTRQKAEVYKTVLQGLGFPIALPQQMQSLWCCCQILS